ncbi:MAG: dihydrolipoamide acetyltransferase family protein [Candidatus Methylacidiphilales bacterium]
MAQMIEMPKLSDTMTEGTVGEWLKKEGDTIESGDVIARVETDKATMDLESFESGTLLKIVVTEGQTVPTGAPVAYVGKPGETIDEAALKKPVAEKTEPAETAPEEKSGDTAKATPEPADTKSSRTPSPAQPSGSTPAGRGRVKASPLAKKIAAELGVSLTGLKGSGPGGRIVKADVLSAGSSSGTSGLYPSGPIADEGPIKLSNMRKTIAKRLVQSKQENPHFYVEVEIDAAPMVRLRSELVSEFAENHGFKPSFNDFVLKAAANAARHVPAINSSFDGDVIQQWGDVHLAFGVALKDGLITPIIREAQNKSLLNIHREALELIAKAKAGQLTPNEYSGGTLTVSNLGGPFGVDRFCAIINPPQAAILAVGNIVKKPVVDESDHIVVGQRMSITLSADHRVIDGAVAATYLKSLKRFLETPALLLL